MAVIHTDHAKARIVINLLLESSVTFGYQKDYRSPANKQDVVEVPGVNTELLRECLEIATARIERAEAQADAPMVTYFKAPIGGRGPFTVKETKLGVCVVDSVGTNCGRSSDMAPGAVFFQSTEEANNCADALNRRVNPRTCPKY